MTENTVYPTGEACGKTKQSTEKWYFETNAATRQHHRTRQPEGQNQVQQTNPQNNSEVNVQAAAQTLS